MIDQDYYDLRMGGYTEKEVADYFTRILGSGGFSDQEVNAFIVRQKGYYDQLAQEAGVAEPAQTQAAEPGFWDAAVKGFSHSTSGLRMQVGGSEAFKDQISDEASAALPWYKRFVRDAAGVAGDLPDMAVGALGGGAVAGPVGAAAGAFGVASGNRALLMEQLKNGDVQSYEALRERWARLS